MSTGVGTIKPTRGRSIWPVAVVVSVVMLTVAVIAFSLDRGEPAPATSSKVEAPAVAIAPGTSANTPSELRGVTVAKRHGVTSQAQTGGTTPIELSGGMDAKNDFVRFGLHQRI